MRYLAMIQARCGSSRLPRKVLKDLCGKTVLERVIERVQQSKYVDEVMVVTSLNPEDIPIVNKVSELGLRVYCGSSLDVLDRYYQASRLIKPDNVIRITADCPVFDYELLDEAIGEFKEDSDYLGSITETFADGLDLEIVRYDSLEKCWSEAKLLSEREHVTLYIKNHKELFNIQDFVCKLGDLHNERWTIDEPEDYIFIKKLYEYFLSINKKYFLTSDIIKYLNENPDIREINKGFIRNEGLLISLEKDKKMKVSEKL